MTCITPLDLLMPLPSVACSLIQDSPVEAPTLSISRYFLLLVLTCFLEAPVYWFFAKGLSARARVVQNLLLNLATHPAVTWGLPYLFLKARFSTYVWGAEAFAWFVEALILFRLYRYPKGKALAVSALANLTSWWVGLLILG
ncbi:hypothetical protein K2X30_06665 [bacterium]|jgi:hypothetical protein|nr:hypothetical protein [bacterium]